MTIVCPRCSRPCQVAPLADPPGRLLTRSTVPSGLCPNCAVRVLLAATPLARLAETSPAGPAAFLVPHVQAQFVQLMARGGAQMRPDEIDWEAVVAQWDLPLRGTRRRRQSSP